MKVWIHLDHERYSVDTAQWELGEFVGYDAFNRLYGQDSGRSDVHTEAIKRERYEQNTNKGIRIALAKLFEITEGEANDDLTRKGYAWKASEFLLSQIHKGGFNPDFQFQIVCDEVNNTPDFIKQGTLLAHCIWQYHPGEPRHRCIISNQEVIC